MIIEPEELEEYEVLNYFEDDYQEYWREQMLRTDWEPAKELVELLKTETFFEKYGADATLIMLCDGESLLSYLAKDSDGQIKYLYTFEEYRGNGCAKKLLEE